MLVAFLWVVFVIATLITGGVLTVLTYLARLARRGTSGTEYVGMASAPLLVAMPLVELAGGVSGLSLAARSNQLAAQLVTGILGTMLLGLVVLSAIAVIRNRGQNAREDRITGRVMDRDEMLALIRAGEIDSFRREGVTVGVTYTNYWQNGEYRIRPRNANGEGYAAYVVAANEARIQGRRIFYYDRDRANSVSPGTRWITVEEATTLLQTGKINTFCYGTPAWLSLVPPRAALTGIMLDDDRFALHLYVEPAMEATMVPVARQARATNGTVPQFVINGRWEPPGVSERNAMF